MIHIDIQISIIVDIISHLLIKKKLIEKQNIINFIIFRFKFNFYLIATL